MDGLKQEIGTITVVDDETIEDRYKRCGLLNVIQHIDIYGKFRSSYVEQTKSRVQGNDTPLAITSISASSGRFSNLSDAYSDVTRPKSVSTKLSKFSVTTRVSGLYPGHDILSRRARKCRLSDKKNNVCFGAYVSR
ncbi:uncharacterized protein LOC114364553 [Ostrinia furnacalis]|uniref:uncharacterized protein LOC114364553 n=1 Tax=Ostrinia furnacalis TaxID=93504 RepID=UPI00103E9252|nr:uncharacterized protein LOC114364553 [Ostrinia furnacalis]